jgi:hypothetical protein
MKLRDVTFHTATWHATCWFVLYQVSGLQHRDSSKHVQRMYWLYLLPWRRRWQGPPKYLYVFTTLHGVTFQQSNFHPHSEKLKSHMAMCIGDASVLLIIFPWYSKPQACTQTKSTFTDLYDSFILYTASYMFRHSAFSWEAQQTEPRHSDTQAA